jgi:hypothetical protein
MTKRDDQRSAQLRQRLADFLTEPHGMLPGGLVERMTKCGKQNCRCNGVPPQLHGPYIQWGYSKGHKRITRWLTPEQAERYRPLVERGRQFTELLATLDEIEASRVERAEGWGT